LNCTIEKPGIQPAAPKVGPAIKSITSFDVFDTLMTRSVGRPSSLFLWLGNRLVAGGKIGCSAEAFASARREAERRAVCNCPGGEPNLREIHAELAWSLGMDADLRDQVMGAELDFEEECICVVPGAVERVAEARGRGAVIAFLSDMYLPRNFIIRQLQHQGLWSEGDLCFVSGDCRLNKRSGQMFDELLERTSVSAKCVVHCGNDARADIASPRSRGIRTTPFLSANLNRYEEILESCSRDTQGLSSAFAGAARLARLGVGVEGAHLSAVRDVSASVAAPILTAYVLWILREAKESGITPLYFVSRDGQILLEIARRLAPKIGFRGECRYLYGGRQAWFLPALASDTSRLADWCFEDTDFLSVRSQLTRAGLQPEQFAEEIGRLGLTPNTWSENLNPSARQRLWAWLGSAPVLQRITSEAVLRRDLIWKYFAQERILASANWGLVDVGWRGRLQYFLERLLAEKNARPPTSFYFALQARESYPSSGQQQCYFFDGGNPIGYMKDIPWLATPIEIFCAATHGVVLGYEDRQGSVRPILREERNTSAISWGLETAQETIKCFVDHLHLDPDLAGQNADLRPCTSRILQAFWNDPQKQEAAAWGRFQFERDQAGAYQSTLAKRFSITDVRRAYGCGRLVSRHSQEWKAASIALTHPCVRMILAIAGRTGRSVARAKRLIGGARD
jgi:predicted HAD superfamily hydrolase